MNIVKTTVEIRYFRTRTTGSVMITFKSTLMKWLKWLVFGLDGGFGYTKRETFKPQQIHLLLIAIKMYEKAK